MQNSVIDDNTTLEKDVKKLLDKADILINNTITNVTYELVNLYWNIGKMIIKYKRENNSKYGDAVISQFSIDLSLKYGKGFSRANIKFAVQFYNTFQKSSPASQFKNVSWSHYREMLILKDIKIINYYLNEVTNKSLTKLELRNNIKSKSFERIIANQRKDIIKNEIEKTLKDPIILNIQNKKEQNKN